MQTENQDALTAFEAQLVAMAADLEIQRELRAIGTEFTETEIDGLE